MAKSENTQSESFPMVYEPKTNLYKIGDLVLTEDLIIQLEIFQKCGNWHSNILAQIALTLAAHTDFNDEPGEHRMKDFYESVRDISNFTSDLEYLITKSREDNE